MKSLSGTGALYLMIYARTDCGADYFIGRMAGLEGFTAAILLAYLFFG